MKIATTLLVFLIPISAFALDQNTNGMSDVFESIYQVTDPNADPDGDGKSNIEESHAGTNPHDNADFFTAEYSEEYNPLQKFISWESKVFINYGIQISSNLGPSSWLTIPGSHRGTGNLLTVKITSFIASSPNRNFFRVRILQADDADSDGLVAWEEYQLGTSDSLLDDDSDLIPSVLEVVQGTDPLNSSSPSSAASYLQLGNESDAFEVFTSGM